MGMGNSCMNGKCGCSCSDALTKANVKIESLEKKIRLLMEENKVLKYLATEAKDKEIKVEKLSEKVEKQERVEQKFEKFSVEKFDYQSTPPISQPIPLTKSLFEKSVGPHDLIPPPIDDDYFELPEKIRPKGSFHINLEIFR